MNAVVSTHYLSFNSWWVDSLACLTGFDGLWEVMLEIASTGGLISAEGDRSLADVGRVAYVGDPAAALGAGVHLTST